MPRELTNDLFPGLERILAPGSMPLTVARLDKRILNTAASQISWMS